MTVLTLSVSLPSEFVHGASVGTINDWLIIQKSGDNYLSRIAASPSAFGAAAVEGDLTSNFSAKLFYLPETGSLWGTSTPANQTGITINATANVVTLWGANLRVRDNTTTNDDYSLLRCGSLDILNTSNAVVASISNAGAIAGASVAATGAVSGASLAVTGEVSGASASITGTVSCAGLYTNSGAATVGTLQFYSDISSYLSCDGSGIISLYSGSTLCAQLSSATFISKGHRAYTNNTYPLGNSTYRWTEVFATNGVINTSDLRDKVAVAECDLGLDFIAALRPISYRWKDKVVRIDIDPATRKDVAIHGPGIRRHYGLGAQDVGKALAGRDFAGYIYDPDTDTYALRHHEFIAPLIKALQEERSARLALEDRLFALEALFAEIVPDQSTRKARP